MTASELYFSLQELMNSKDLHPDSNVILSIPDPRGSDRIAQCPISSISQNGRTLMIFGDYDDMDFE